MKKGLMLLEDSDTGLPVAVDVSLSPNASDVDIDDERAFALSEYLECDISSIQSYSDDEFEVISGEHAGESYRVLTDDELKDAVVNSLEEYLFDAGMPEGWEDYISDAYIEDSVTEYFESEFEGQSEDEIMQYLVDSLGIEELVAEKVICLKDGVDAEDSDFDAEDLDNYEFCCDNWKLQELFVAQKKENQDVNSLFWDYDLGYGLDEVITDYMRTNRGRFPWWFDGDGLIESTAMDIINVGDEGNQLALYDGQREEFEFEGKVWLIFRTA